MNWQKNLKTKVREQEPLKNHTTFKIGGPARFFSQPKNYDQLKELLGSAKENKIPVFILGAGSNILAGDKGLNALVLKLDSARFKEIIYRADCLIAGSGVLLSQLINSAASRGICGFEFLAGIPATVGGALAMNAGAWGENIANSVQQVEVMEYNGRMKILNKTNIRFSYRKSNLSKYIILNARFKILKKNKAKIRERIKEYLTLRRNSQGMTLPNAGCIFKNPAGESAGKLIELCGLKGKKSGGACISRKHANFIVNQGRASAKDVLKLIGLVKRKVKHKFGLDLEPEIKIWD